MVRRGTVFSHAAFRYVDVVIGAIVAAALVWFAVMAINAPGQRADPGVTLIMGGVGALHHARRPVRGARVPAGRPAAPGGRGQRGRMTTANAPTPGISLGA